MHFQWYPGHMTKAKRMMQENIKLIDLVIELVDARVPISSRNPDIDELGKNKARLILLNKSDLAEDKWNDAWSEYFREKGFSVVKVNSKKGGGIKSINGVIQEACRRCASWAASPCPARRSPPCSSSTATTIDIDKGCNTPIQQACRTWRNSYQ